MNKSNAMKMKIKNLELSMTNPRFTFLKNFEDDLIEFISRENNEYNEEKAILQLIKSEGNLSDFIQLVDSIKKYGWMDLGEEILVIQSKNKYIVAEGNRRILALKLILKFNKLPPIKKLSDLEDFIEYESHDKEIAKNSKDEKLETNYSKLNTFLSEINKIKNLDSDEIDCRIIFRSDELWRFIYTKHIVGERPGMRKWSRGKYFVDILNFFPNGVDKTNDEINKKITMKIQREINIVFDDYIQAQFIRDIFQSENDDLDNSYRMMSARPVSALQTNFSIKNIREAAKKELLISKEEFKNLFRIEIEKETGKISYKVDAKLDKNKFLNFIYKEYINGTLTTRPIDTKKYKDFAKGVRFLLSGLSIDFDEDNSEEKINSIDGFDLKSSDIMRILNSSENLSKDTRKRLSLQKIIMDDDEKIIDVIKKSSLDTQFEKNDPGNVFQILRNQLAHNTSEKRFVAAQSFTLRALYEQLIIWGAYFVDDLLKSLHSQRDLLSAQNQHIDELANHDINISKLKDKIIGSKKNIKNKTDIEDFLTKMLKDKPSKNDIDFFHEFSTGELNNFIHASHRMVALKNYNEKLLIINKLQKGILSIVDKIDNEKIKKLSDEIKMKID